MRSPSACLMLALSTALSAATELPDEIADSGEILVTTARAVGSQIYECRPDGTGGLAWHFREPIAALFIDGKDAGRHYAGPTWEMTDGSTVRGQVSARFPGARPDDIPLLKLDATSWTGAGQLNGVSTIRRLNTRGGNIASRCEEAGAFLSAPYTADYAFYRKRN